MGICSFLVHWGDSIAQVRKGSMLCVVALPSCVANTSTVVIWGLLERTLIAFSVVEILLTFWVWIVELGFASTLGTPSRQSMSRHTVAVFLDFISGVSKPDTPRAPTYKIGCNGGKSTIMSIWGPLLSYQSVDELLCVYLFVYIVLSTRASSTTVLCCLHYRSGPSCASDGWPNLQRLLEIRRHKFCGEMQILCMHSASVTHMASGVDFHHLDWIAFVEQCRPVYSCLVFIIKGTLSSNEDENA